MSFLDRFKNKTAEAPPPGVNLQYSSFQQPANQSTYTPPPIQQPPAPPSQPRQRGKPGGGWQDDDPSPQKAVPASKLNTVNLIGESPPKPINEPVVLLPPQPSNTAIQLSRVVDFKRGQLLTYEELEIGGFEHEFHLVNEVIKLGGIRLKQADSVLKEFASAVQNLQEQVVGSILLNKLYSEENFKVQIRCLFAISHLSALYANYRDFFQINQQYLKFDTDQTLLANQMDQTLADVNGIQTNKKQDVLVEFREPPNFKPAPPQQAQTQPQQQNILDIIDLTEPQSTSQNSQPSQQVPQQKQNAFTFLKSKQQPPQQQQTQKSQAQQQYDLLSVAFNDINLADPLPQQWEQPAQPVKQQQPNFEQVNLLSAQQQQPAQQKKNAFGFIKKDNNQPSQSQDQPTQQVNQLPYQQPYQAQTQSRPYQQQQPPAYMPQYGTQLGTQQAGQKASNNDLYNLATLQLEQLPNGRTANSYAPYQTQGQAQPRKMDDNAFDFLNL